MAWYWNIFVIYAARQPVKGCYRFRHNWLNYFSLCPSIVTFYYTSITGNCAAEMYLSVYVREANNPWWNYSCVRYPLWKQIGKLACNKYSLHWTADWHATIDSLIKKVHEADKSHHLNKESSAIRSWHSPAVGCLEHLHWLPVLEFGCFWHFATLVSFFLCLD